MPASHVNGPFSVRRPLKELHPGPPLNHMAISSFAAALLEGKNQKKSSRVSLEACEIGSKPA